MYFACLKLLLPLCPVMLLSVNQRLSFFSLTWDTEQANCLSLQWTHRSGTLVVPTSWASWVLAAAWLQQRWSPGELLLLEVGGKLSWWICVLIQLDYFPCSNHVLENYHYFAIHCDCKFLCRHTPRTDPFLIFSSVNRLSSWRVWLKGGFSGAQIIFLVFFGTLSNPLWRLGIKLMALRFVTVLMPSFCPTDVLLFICARSTHAFFIVALQQYSKFTSCEKWSHGFSCLVDSVSYLQWLEQRYNR